MAFIRDIPIHLGVVPMPASQAALCKRLVDIGGADIAAYCLIARAEDMVEYLGTVTHGIPAGQI